MRSVILGVLLFALVAFAAMAEENFLVTGNISAMAIPGGTTRSGKDVAFFVVFDGTTGVRLGNIVIEPLDQLHRQNYVVFDDVASEDANKLDSFWVDWFKKEGGGSYIATVAFNGTTWLLITYNIGEDGNYYYYVLFLDSQGKLIAEDPLVWRKAPNSDIIWRGRFLQSISIYAYPIPSNQ